MNDNDQLQFWHEHRGKIISSNGGLVIDSARVIITNHGLSMMDEIIGTYSFFQILALNSTGRQISPELAIWLEAAFLCVSYPDARIWCNQIGSLAGTLGTSPVAAAAAGILASDSRLYGPGTQRAGATFIHDALLRQKNGDSPTDIVSKHHRRDSDGSPLIPGYARPMVGGRDERIEPLERVRSEQGLAMGPHLKLAFELSAVLESFGRSINAMGYCVAFLCDQGFDATAQYRLVSAMVLAGVLACYTESADQPGESFMPLACTDVQYLGPAPRPLP